MSTEPKRVLQVITRSEWGGAQRVVVTLATRVDAETVVACGPGGRLVGELSSRDVPVQILDRLRNSPAPLGDPATLARLVSLVRSGGFDLVHCHSTKAGALARVAARLAGVPVVFTVHGWGFYNRAYGRFRPVVRGGERLLSRVTDAVVCVSEHDRRRGRETGILGPEGGVVVHNGVDPTTAGSDPPPRAEARDRLDREFGIDPGTVVVGTVGRLAPQKAPLAVLRTAASLAGRGLDARTVLVGDGPLRGECERFVAERDLQGVHVAGFREDADELLPGFDVFVLPSRFEGFPLSVLEAMHAGVPVVANDVGGVAEAVRDGETGYVVDPDDSGSFTDRVADLVADRGRRERMGKRGRERASERFTADRMVAGYERVYRRVLAG